MNHNLTYLHPYPFAKMATLLADSSPALHYSEIKLGIGEPKHAPPAFVLDVLRENLDTISRYPTTNGLFELRQTIAHWLEKRFFLTHVDPNKQVLPVMGTREAIFSLVQAVVDHKPIDKESRSLPASHQPSPVSATVVPISALSPIAFSPIIVMPNPFYQIYEGAAILAQAEPYFVPCSLDNDFKGNYRSVPKDVWARTQLLFVCNPNNPTGSVMTMDDWEYLIRLSDQYGFIIASDECYSELYFDTAPIGLLQACATLGRHDFKNCIVFHSLSKRSNLPGLRSGFVAGDANILQSYLQYRTYQGCAMPIPHQLASIAAWQDEKHVAHNRALYQEKFALWMSELGHLLELRMPEAGFYFWVKVPEQFNGDDEVFVKALYEQANIHALAGRYLSREVNGNNPGQGYVRIALVASVEESREAIERIRQLLAA
ncbi:succinyldiaminopimelate transaminase [Psychrobacter sp. AOP22-C1-22]|uniref:succinyldiaminopimelate transaminase n=1 Tax=unclassified Psychrobacter TaxID=196806 RepID=UPI001787B02D|nr:MULTISPECIES: succinyldiaminopimelate transaminase [unclassified Psychrobacter]MDN5802717.1 succinyldiaminopimelate transaminase [Psychrobacter sp.]MBE0405854.1 succinyldiaminopimelate transaminase [Psychrobacter sp. FME6]MBE0444597.1 succinyldiaminopimelate transaminase [Psychrobacter sp. FME5]MDN5892087.1 succinyldiaminopimelate transaminase [Psychrobacter sp.]MDN5897829.1 succinyldiaminopimelate transaminase [Psychrobacter sp.]